MTSPLPQKEHKEAVMPLEDYAETLRLLTEAVSTLQQAMDALPPAAAYT
jgi:hypothetical protein